MAMMMLENWRCGTYGLHPIPKQLCGIESVVKSPVGLESLAKSQPKIIAAHFGLTDRPMPLI